MIDDLSRGAHSLPALSAVYETIYPSAKSILLPPLLENERYKI